MNKIKKILIANRGEIALRVIATCKVMGIKSVTIYSGVDVDLPHAYQSDEAYCLGDGALSDTYLNQQLILDIAKKSGADAIHPGYGFLSENQEFTHRCEEAGIIFIGPRAETMALMGDKMASKVKMEEIGVPVIPGYHGSEQDPKFLLETAKGIGYPVLIKATAGGGGKGMRVVHKENEFLPQLEGAKREAANAFGNDIVLLEKFITNPRHIEVQVMSDGKNGHYHFYERECSIQRRHQKIVEETPAINYSPKLRKEMTDAAVNITSNIKYRGAGTIEFMLDDDGSYYFLEMNTRLQVEHPVTEFVTGCDLVKLQILVAQGDELNLDQDKIAQKGHSIEVRIYAEDPDNDFLPTIGTINYVGTPTLPNVRLDCGYRNGNEISINYDPLLAKLIVWGENREDAIEKLILSIDEIVFAGVVTNRDYLKRVLKNETFRCGEITTNFVETYKEQLRKKELTDDEIANYIGGFLLTRNKKIGVSVAHTNGSNAKTITPWDTLTGFRNV